MDIAQVKQNIAHIQSVLEKESTPFGRVPKLIAVTKYLSAEDTLQLSYRKNQSVSYQPYR